MASRWFSDCRASCSGPGTKSGMPILYDNPKEVGATASPTPVGAYDLYGGPCVVVDMGTATTVEAISANGEYMGGAITPGSASAWSPVPARPPRCAGSSWSSRAA